MGRALARQALAGLSGGEGTGGRIWESQQNRAQASSVPTEVLPLSVPVLPAVGGLAAAHPRAGRPGLGRAGSPVGQLRLAALWRGNPLLCRHCACRTSPV